MKNTLLLIAAYSCLLAGCSNTDNSNSNDATLTTVPISEQNKVDTVAPTGAEMSAPGIQSSVDPAVTTNDPAVTNATGMNPAHGEPGHRCEIAVGAPLNSPADVTPAAAAPMAAPTPASSTISIPSPSPAATSVTGTPSSTPAGMNPPHGEPGHDCAIAVGAPLKK